MDARARRVATLLGRRLGPVLALVALLPLTGRQAAAAAAVAAPVSPHATVAPATGCTRPTPSAAAEGAALDAIRSTRWTAADLTGSIDLTDGRRLWLYGDTITSGVSPTGGAVSAGFTARSSAIVQDHGCFTPLVNGAGATASSWIPDDGAQWDWPGDGYARSGTVWLYATRLAQVTGGVFGFQAQAVDLVEVDQATLTIRTVHRGRYLASPVLLGGSVTTDGTWTYLYGRDELGTKRNTYVARVAAANPLGATTYWTGGGWSADPAASRPIFTTDVVGGLTVTDLGPAYGDKRYVGVVMDGEFLTRNLEVYHAAAPTGPWWKDTTVSATGLASDSSTWAYMASVHGIDPATGGLHITWNIGSFDSAAVTRNVHAYGEVHRSLPLDLKVPAGAPAVPTTRPIGPPAGLVPLVPTRVLDTRIGQGGLHRLVGGLTYAVPIVGRGGVPAAATGVLATFTAVNPATAAYLTVWPCGSARPNASSINVDAGTIAPNTLLAAIGEAGSVCVFASRDVDLLVDVAGWLGPGGSGFSPIEPARLADTRASARVAAGGRLVVQVAGRAGVPTTASAAALNLTATGVAGAGYVTAWPCDRPQPVASVLNVGPGHDRADNATVPLSAAGTVCLSPSAPMHLVVDVSGWYGPGGQPYQAVSPFRRLDTRVGQGGYGRPGPLQVVSLPVAGLDGVPAGARAVRVNLTVVGPSGATYVTAAPCPRWLPSISNLNSDPGSPARANEGFVALDSRGTLCVASAAAADLLVDVTGYVG